MPYCVKIAPDVVPEMCKLQHLQTDKAPERLILCHNVLYR